MLRLPAVAGQFYPGSRLDLTKTLSELIPEVSAAEKADAIAIVSPHAGYVYSGKVAGETFSKVNIPDDVIILGPSHHGLGLPVALMNQGEWETPLGNVSVSENLASLVIQQSETVEVDETAHRSEHSLEVQVPFLQFLNPDVQIAPICISRLSLEDCIKTGEGLARAIKSYEKPVLIIASTDMTHYESRFSATRKDKFALDSIIALDPTNLYENVINKKISMCGIIPTTIAVCAANYLGASDAKLVRYTDSGETSGDTNRVVAYAGFVIT